MGVASRLPHRDRRTRYSRQQSTLTVYTASHDRLRRPISLSNLMQAATCLGTVRLRTAPRTPPARLSPPAGDTDPWAW